MRTWMAVMLLAAVAGCDYRSHIDNDLGGRATATYAPESVAAPSSTTPPAASEAPAEAGVTTTAPAVQGAPAEATVTVTKTVVTNVVGVMESLKSEMRAMSAQYPELRDRAGVRVGQLPPNTAIYGIDYTHNTDDLGRLGHKDSGPNACHVRFVVCPPPAAGERYPLDIGQPDYSLPGLGMHFWCRLYVGSNATPGFEKAMLEVLNRHTQMLGEIERRARAKGNVPVKESGK